METIEQKLDRLADYEAQRDLIEANKRAALDEVKIPAEVEAIVSAGTKRLNDLQASLRPVAKKLNAECDAKLAQIVIPAEIKAAYEEIERQRALVIAYKYGKEQEIYQKQLEKEQALRAEIDAQVKETYDEVARRKREIEEEFSGNADAVNANIEALKSEIKAETIAGKKTVKGKFYQSIYTAGRVTWNTDMIEGMVALVPQLANARKEGAPSTQLRKL